MNMALLTHWSDLAQAAQNTFESTHKLPSRIGATVLSGAEVFVTGTSVAETSVTTPWTNCGAADGIGDGIGDGFGDGIGYSAGTSDGAAVRGRMRRGSIGGRTNGGSDGFVLGAVLGLGNSLSGCRCESHEPGHSTRFCILWARGNKL